MEKYPDRIAIGTQKRFDNNTPYIYNKVTINGEPMYVCERGSDWARGNELLILRLRTTEDGSTEWVAYDSSVDEHRVIMRQAVFRCNNDNILTEGPHVWQKNGAASKTGEAPIQEWEGRLWCETRVLVHATTCI